VTRLVDNNTDAGRHCEVVAPDPEGVTERIADPLGEHGCSLGGRVLREDRKLVTAQARGKVGCS
jgi:hypothetical protein